LDELEDQLDRDLSIFAEYPDWDFRGFLDTAGVSITDSLDATNAIRVALDYRMANPWTNSEPSKISSVETVFNKLN